jgi:hypothetical protein
MRQCLPSPIFARFLLCTSTVLVGLTQSGAKSRLPFLSINYKTINSQNLPPPPHQCREFRYIWKTFVPSPEIGAITDRQTDRQTEWDMCHKSHIIYARVHGLSTLRLVFSTILYWRFYCISALLYAKIGIFIPNFQTHFRHCFVDTPMHCSVNWTK